MSESNNEYYRILVDDSEKGMQIRLVISEFREVEYLHIRKYYCDYAGEWHPTKDGISFPTSISSIYNLLDALIEICSKCETVDSVKSHFDQILSNLDGR
jgi:hypothetical protein